MNDLLLLKQFPKLDPVNAIALIRAARLYQDALWIAESEPSLSWVMFVSAVETAAAHWKASESSPVENLLASIPELYNRLESIEIPGLLKEVAEMIVHKLGATKKFVDFMMTFLPDPPAARPAEWGQCSWESNIIKKTLMLIYEYRSQALHGGYPFPAPMCQPPFQHESWKSLSEKPIGHATSMRGGVWLAKDTPMLLHIFEYIVRHSLIKWWRSMVESCN